MFDNYLKFLIEITKKSGDELRNGFHTTFKISSKSRINDLVTEYDLKSEKIIIESIKSNFPEHNILAEESGELHFSDSDYIWIIDPLDGTVNFANGLEIFSVSIALQYKGELIVGAVYNPISDELFYAQKGKGAFLNSNPIEVNKCSDVLQSLLITGFPYNVSENPQNCIETFNKVLRKNIPVRRLGSAAIDMCYVACGRFGGFWEPLLKPWDIAAGKLILEEAGGIVTDYQGLTHNLFSKNLVATNSLIHSDLLDILNEN